MTKVGRHRYNLVHRCRQCGRVLKPPRRRYCSEAHRKAYERSGAKGLELPEVSAPCVLLPTSAALRLASLLTHWKKPDGIHLREWSSLLKARRLLTVSELDILRLMDCADDVETILGIVPACVADFTRGGQRAGRTPPPQWEAEDLWPDTSIR